MERLKTILRTALTERSTLLVLLLSLTITCLMTSSWFYYERQQWLNLQQEQALKKAKKSAFQAVSVIDDTLKMVESAARSLAHELNSGKANISNLEERLRAISKTTPLIFGLGSAYQPEVLAEFLAKGMFYNTVNEKVLLTGKGAPPTSLQTTECTPLALQPYLFAPYLKRNDKDHRQRDMVMVNQKYDYTCPEKFWYLCPLGLDPLNCPTPQPDSWLEPYFGQASERMVEEFSLPFYAPEMVQKNGIASGSVWANMSLNDFKRLLSSMNLGQFGYGFILSPKGNFIAHPNNDYIKLAKNIQDVQNKKGADLYDMFKRAVDYGTQIGEHIDPQSGHDAIWIFEPIHRTKWVLGLVYQQQDLQSQPNIERRQIILIVLPLIAACLFITLLLIRQYSAQGTMRFWLYTLTVSAFLICAIASAWYTVISYPIYKDGSSVSMDTNTDTTLDSQQQSHMIFNEWQVEKFKNKFAHQQLKPNSQADNTTIYLPTGLFIQSLNFVDANSVKLTGYIWQKLPADAASCLQQSSVAQLENKNLGFWVEKSNGECQRISAGVIFPEAKDIDTSSPWPFLETYRHATTNGGITVGWYFDILLRERFDYQLYPFDVENVWLRMWHKDIGKNVILTPDLAAYSLSNIKNLPGLEADFVLPGWQLVSSFFDYKVHGYQTNFGIEQFKAKDNFPELHFNIILKRRFLGIFVGNLMPLLVVLVVLFALVLSTSKVGNIEILGFNFSGVLASSSGLLFGVLLGHTELRSSLNASGLVYLESFYLIMYMMLLLVILNAYIFCKHPDFFIVKWSDNLLAKLIFWPLLLGLILIVTLSHFYF